MLDWLADKIDEVEAVDELHVVDERTLRARRSRRGRPGARAELRPVVHDDGTTSNDDRLGAIGDIAFTIERGGLAGDDLLVVAGDNLFEFSLAEYVDLVAGHVLTHAGGASAIAVRDCGDIVLARQYAVVRARRRRPRALVRREARASRQSTLVVDRDLPLRPRHVPLIDDYLAGGNTPDAPGRLVAWLHTRRPVYGYRLEGEWFDVGDREQLLVADNWLRRTHGLPERDEYSLA